MKPGWGEGALLTVLAAAAFFLPPPGLGEELLPVEAFRRSALQELEKIHQAYLSFVSGAGPSVEEAIGQVRALQADSDYLECVLEQGSKNEADRPRACREIEKKLKAVIAVPRPRYDVLDKAIGEGLKRTALLARKNPDRWMASVNLLDSFYGEYANQALFVEVRIYREGQQRVLDDCAVPGRPESAALRCEVEGTLASYEFRLRDLSRRNFGEEAELSFYKQARSQIEAYADPSPSPEIPPGPRSGSP